MGDAALRDGAAHRESLFEAFARRLPDGRRYGIVAGTGRLLELIHRFRFEEADLECIRANEVGRPAPIDGLPPTGRAAERGRRRTREVAAVAAARAAYIAGFDATSNLEAGRTWGIPTMGTAAHAFTLLHDSEEAAFRAQVEAFGPKTTLLIDTYDITKGVETAVRVAGTELGAVRIDSGDLPSVVMTVREQLDSLGAVDTRITVTSDLDEFTIAALSAAPVDSYGVGTAVVTGSGFPAAGMVYKLVARRDDTGEWVAVAKVSPQKASVGGRKNAARRLDSTHTAREELVFVGDGPDGEAEFGGGTRPGPLRV